MLGILSNLGCRVTRSRVISAFRLPHAPREKAAFAKNHDISSKKSDADFRVLGSRKVNAGLDREWAWIGEEIGWG